MRLSTPNAGTLNKPLKPGCAREFARTESKDRQLSLVAPATSAAGANSFVVKAVVTSATRRLGPCLIDVETLTIESAAIYGLDRELRLGIVGHFN